MVDDDHTLIRAISRRFDQERIIYFSCSGARRAMEVIEEGALYTVAVLDIELGRYSGFEVGELSRYKNPSAHIIYYSGLVEQVHTRILNMNNTTFVQKPNDEMLMKLISQYIVEEKKNRR